MVDPSVRADLPASWLPEATGVTPKPAAYQHAVMRKVKNTRHARVLDMGELAEDLCRRLEVDATHLESFTKAEWRKLSVAAGHPDTVPSEATRAAIVAKVARDLSEPYRAKGRG